MAHQLERWSLSVLRAPTLDVICLKDGKMQVLCCISLRLSHRFLLICSFRYLYILYLAIDANFKLKGKDRKLTDVDLTPGLGAFVNEEQYQDFIKDYVDQPEVSLFVCLR